MNERIYTLAEQAGINIDSFQFSGTPIKHIVDEPSLKKFAELIVRECIDIVEGFTIEQEVALDDYQEYEASAVLKEHFGIEE